jgi:hypothetical protein
MPQRVHYSTESIAFDFRPEVLLERPLLAAHIAVISGLWNEIEARTGALLAALLGPEAKTAITIFVSLQNDGARRAAIDAICSLKLSPNDFLKFQTIQKAIGQRYGERNRAVHGAWGISPKFPDKLLWCDVREVMLFHVNMMDLAGPGKAAERRKLNMQQQQSLLVYGEKDFIDIETRIVAAYADLCEFSKPIIERGFGPSAKVDLKPSPPRPRGPVLPVRDGC